MKESLKRNTNLSLNVIHHAKLVHSISQLGTQVLNQSLQIDSLSQNSADSQQLLRMQIKQLKRQNTFLKAKIQQLKKGVIQPKTPLLKRQSLNCLNILKKRPDPKVMTQQSSLNFILKQIQSVLKSLGSLYKVEIDQKQWNLDDSLFCQNRQQQTKILKSHKEYKQKLNKRLEMLALSKEQTRYQSMLDIFMQYYQLKNGEEKKIRQKIQKFIQKTIQISKKFIQKANTKAYERSMRSSCIHSVQQQHSEISQLVPNITLNDSYIFRQPRLKFSDKHQLSYSTIDGQNINKEID